MSRYLLMFVLLMFGAPSARAADAGADLALRAARLDIARPMNTLGYNAVVVNDGPETATNVEILVLLPPGTTVRNGEECTGARSLLRCALGSLAAGEVRRVFVLLVSPERSPRVTAIAVSETADPEASNNVR